jgi:hypothetical protein
MVKNVENIQQQVAHPLARTGGYQKALTGPHSQRYLFDKLLDALTPQEWDTSEIAISYCGRVSMRYL